MSIIGCATEGPPKREHYLRYVAYELPFQEEHRLLRWEAREMPLQVYLPRPPEGMFASPDAVHASVRSAVLAWSDVVEPGVPSFEFVDSAGQADVPFVWAPEPEGEWYVAYCTTSVFARRFRVDQIVVTARWPNGRIADPWDVYQVVLHEMGHSLGLAGHSPHPEDVMYKALTRSPKLELSERDRATLRLLYSRPVGTPIADANR